MQKNDLLKKENVIVRVLHIDEERVLIIDCVKKTMPQWMSKKNLEEYDVCDEVEICGDFCSVDIEELDAKSRKIAHERYTMIAGVLSFYKDKIMRTQAIEEASKEYEISKQTIRDYLCKYLVYQNIAALAPKSRVQEDVPLNEKQKIMRNALNRYFYTTNKNSLRTAYNMMLKEHFCDENGKLTEDYIKFHQFKYFYRKTRKMSNFYISRDGKKHYERNNRVCLGDGVRGSFAPAPGVMMFDATVADCYLTNDKNEVVGRPIISVAIDAYSSLVYGIYVGWKNDVVALLKNIVCDKVQFMAQYGITINEEQWPVKNVMGGEILTDRGTEYTSEQFSQLCSLGITVENLDAYRPDEKSLVEKWFHLLHASIKPYLLHRGFVDTDFGLRGCRDYRKDSCMTLDMFTKIVLHFVLFHNTQWVQKGFPFTEEMLDRGIQPYCNCIWNYGRTLDGVNLIPVSEEQLTLTLLPRTKGVFTRFGLKVNKMRYRNSDFTQQYLQGGDATVAYDPKNTSYVWLVTDRGEYVRFELIEKRYADRSLEDVDSLKQRENKLIKEAETGQLQANIDFATHIEAIAKTGIKPEKVNVKNIRKTREREMLRCDMEGQAYDE